MCDNFPGDDTAFLLFEFMADFLSFFGLGISGNDRKSGIFSINDCTGGGNAKNYIIKGLFYFFL